MGIKDNFSQAVKELWKKDGQEESPTAPAVPSELDSYLRQQELAQSQTEQSAPAASAAAPAQTPPVQPVQTAQPPEQPVGSTQPMADAAAGAVPLETPYYRSPNQPPVQEAAGGMNMQSAPEQPDNGFSRSGYQRSQYGAGGTQNSYPQSGYPQNSYPQGSYNANAGGANGGYNGSFGGGFVPPTANGMGAQEPNETDEVTVISKNTMIDGNVRSLANMQIDGSIKGDVETTRNIDMTGKIIGDVTCNNAGMNSAAMQGNVSLKGRMRMDRDTILIGDLTSQYADINGRVRGKLDIAGKAELKRDAIVFGDINASTIAVTDGAIIQGYVNTTFLSKEDSRNVFPDAISIDSKEPAKS